MKRSALQFVRGLLLVALFQIAVADSESTRNQPNIVFIFADDLGYGDLGCYGHPYARTPAIDQLAKEGTRFTQFYVTGVTCNPSRTGLMTGLHPARFPKYAADFGFGDRVSITELLKKRGYRTGHFGKWHMGPHDAHGTYGIDTIRTIGKSKSRSGGRDDDLFSAAIEFIKKNKDGPFYVNVWGHATHYPVNTPAGLAAQFNEVKVDRKKFSATMQGKFDRSLKIDGDLDQSMQQYLGDVFQIDLNVARVLRAIEELGIKEKTIVVFSSDHGPAPVGLGKKGVREFSKNMLGYAGKFRGGKHSQFEGGVRVPFIIRWPGKVKAGRVDEKSVCSFIDWMPTLAAVTGIGNLPERLDGEDISQAWLGETHQRLKPLFWKTSSRGSSPAMREGKWKLHLPRKQKQGAELYDLSVDPSESNNVAVKHPEVVGRLSKVLRQWVRELPADYEKMEKKPKRKRASR